MLRGIGSSLQHTRTRLANAVAPGTAYYKTLCAQYGYGLTISAEGQVYYFHLPDIDQDPEQDYMMKFRKLPEGRTLRRLRRRTHAGMNILDIGTGCGARAVFFALSMHAGSVHTIVPTSADRKLVYKNVVLNDVAETVHVSQLIVAESAKPAGPDAVVGTVDGYCCKQHIEGIDLISLDLEGLETATLDGASEVLSRHGPALMVWRHESLSTPDLRALIHRMHSHGYEDPETWDHGILFWMSRV